MHIAPDSPSLLARILARAGPLPCKPAGDGEVLRRGQILVAPPDRHLVVEDDRVQLTVGPRENGHRPAVDVLFRSAAQAKGLGVIGVILSGTRGDGAVGLAAVKSSGEHDLHEQLASSKRELEEAYEELRSTVEELETMNEELQSTNEELETMNDELRHRTLELNEMNTFLETILTTIGLAVIVIDRRQHVRIWNGQARELWGLTPEEVENQHLFSLDIGLPVEKLRPQLKALLSGQSDREEAVVEATNRRGRTFQCRVTCLPLGPVSDDGLAGVIVMMEVVDA